MLVFKIERRFILKNILCRCLTMCITKDISPVVADHLQVLFLALLGILSQLPDTFTPDLLAVVFPEQPDLLFILCLHWTLSIWNCFNLKPWQNQSGEQHKYCLSMPESVFCKKIKKCENKSEELTWSRWGCQHCWGPVQHYRWAPVSQGWIFASRHRDLKGNPETCGQITKHFSQRHEWPNQKVHKAKIFLLITLFMLLYYNRQLRRTSAWLTYHFKHLTGFNRTQFQTHCQQVPAVPLTPLCTHLNILT